MPNRPLQRPLFLTLFVAMSSGTITATRADLSLQPVVTTNLSQPLFVAAPEGDGRLFVVEKTGRIKIVENGAVLGTPFLDLSGSIDTAGERGLLGLAFDPNFSTNGRFYVNYIDGTTRDTVVARYTAPTPTSDIANPTGQVIITVDQPSSLPGGGPVDNHKAGWIGFRPNEPNNLYIATGDGGSGNDPAQVAQNLGSNLGKMLRVDVSGNGAGYAIPAGNPFAGATPGNDEIWAYGLRNPFRNSFDRLTGDLYIADVGQNTREEVNFEAGPGAGGRNYGWRAREGSGDNSGVADPAPPNATNPIFDYLRGGSVFSTAGQASSITGGYVYRGGLVPELDGAYLFADYVTGRIGSFKVVNGVATNVLDLTADLNPTGSGVGAFDITSFGEDGFGELYVVDFDGAILRIVPEPSAAALATLALALFTRRRP